jgi:GTP diphosphokinase / guanosine-3',5'-bis(diphosphate) 3'-diphosphatase
MKVTKTLKDILSKQNFSSRDKKLIEKAYNFSKKVHAGQNIDLKGHIQYFNHPACVGYFLAKWEQSSEAIAAGLLHDIVEDCEVSLNYIKNNFSKKVAFYVEGMSWFKRNINGEYRKDWPGYFKKFCDFSKKDPVLVIIKSGDEMSKFSPKNVKKVVKLWKEKGIWGKYQKMVNERMRAFWIPLFEEVGMNNVVKKLKEKSEFVKKGKKDVILFNLISKKDLKKIKEKLDKMEGIEDLK